MENMLKKFSILAFAVVALVGLASCAKDNDVRLLYWNIQNGMWDGQTDNYDRFVEFVKSNDPDICVWCEAQTIYKTGTAENMAEEERYLPDNWGEIASRYGHQYWGIGGYRDNYPQVITSKYPIKYVDKLLGDPDDVIVCHGAGWATVEVNGKTVNIVTLHTWPMSYEYRAEDREASTASNGGDRYRAREMKYICEHTISTVDDAENQMWMMMGDFNSISIADNDQYGFPEDTAKFLVHNYIRENTPYIDAVREKNGKFIPSVGGGNSRIDYVYCTKPLYDRIETAEIVWDDYTTPVRNPEGISNFWHPSDHLPIIIDFNMK